MRTRGGDDPENVLVSTASTHVLAIPSGWVIDAGSHERLTRQLARADARWSGVVAQQTDLLPGASYRVLSERMGLTSETEIAPTPDATIRGAVLVRAGVAFDVGDDVVTVPHGHLLVDRGTTVYDPWSPLGTVEHASPLGRPFGPRPVVLFLGFESDPYLADWVRASVNNLVRRNTEGRIAVPRPTGGLHLTAPCSPTEESVAALAPNVIVALDETAVERSAQWLGDDSPTVVIELTPDTTSAVELGSWPAGLRRQIAARIGRGINAASMVDLVQRLVPEIA